MKKLWTMLTILCLATFVAGCGSGSDTETKGTASGNGKLTNGQTQTPKPKTPWADNTEKPADANNRQPETTQPSNDRKPGANENTKFPEDDKDEEDQ